MTDLGENILRIINEKASIDSLELSSILREDHQKIIGCIKSLQSLGNVIETEQQNTKCWQLTPEGEEIALNGSHEALLYNAVPENGGILQSQLMKVIPNAKVGFSKAMSLGWISIDKSEADKPRISRKVLKIEDEVRKDLLNVKNNTINAVSEIQRQSLKKRKLLQEIIVKSYLVKKGEEFSLSITKLDTELTPEMIASNSWREKKFKAYNFDSMGVPIERGHLHPLLKVRAEFRQIFLEMGFTEMPTNNFIESSFWNFDALFQPQQHPARDAHDTFFISDPKMALELPMDYLSRVKTVHQDGNYGSKGYRYEWKIEEAQKNLLRTHTTAVSARILYDLASKGFTPAKYFSIDRVFRNETLDATHLAEFHQIEGVVVDYDLTLGDLIGIIHEFFNKLGITQLRFKPTYNPYTEPSMEIFSYHSGLRKWVEIGNSGMFRPEMLLPMGLPPNVKVLGWGLSLERPTMIKYGIDNIRDLVGHKINLRMVHDNPLCRLDKPSASDVKNDFLALEKRQEKVFDSLYQIKRQIEATKQKLMDQSTRRLKITSTKPTVSLLILQRLMQINSIEPFVIIKTDAPRNDSKPNFSTSNDVTIWVGSTEIHGEVNLARYLSRYLSSSHDDNSDEKNAITATLIDQWLDMIHVSVIHGNNKERAAVLRNLNSHLGGNVWLVGNDHSLADIVMWSALHQTMECVASAPNHVRRWLGQCSSLPCYDDACRFVAQL